MSDPFIVIQSEGVSLSKTRGFLEVRSFVNKDLEPRRFPLDALSGVLVESKGVSFSKSAITALADAGIPLVLTDENHQPSVSMVAYRGHHRTAEMITGQSEMKLPVRKSAWKRIVQEKIRNQDAVLRKVHNDTGLQHIAMRVKSGDVDNRESVAARLYWSRLFGKGFKRETAGGDLNGVLNYGYAILRAAMAQEIALTGLHPALGVHHRNGANPFRLVDDLIEPYRPTVDYLGFLAVDEGLCSVSKRIKHLMVQLFHEPLFRNVEWGRSLRGALRGTARSYAAKVKDGRVEFLPAPKDLMSELFKVSETGALMR